MTETIHVTVVESGPPGSIEHPNNILTFLQKSTIDATPDVSSIALAAGELVHFKGTVLATSDLFLAAKYSFEGLIQNNAGATSFLIAPSVSTDYEDVAGWDVSVAVNDTTDSLEITFTGAAATNINWLGKIELLKVS